MRRLVVFEEWLNRVLEGVVTLFFFAILGLTVMLVVLRYGFNSSIIWGSEAMNYLFIYTTALGAAASVSRGTHIRIACVVELASGRLRMALEFLVFVLIGVINGVLCYTSLAWIASVGSFESPVMRLPLWAVYSAVPVGCGLAVLYCLLRMVRILAGYDKAPQGKTC